MNRKNTLLLTCAITIVGALTTVATVIVSHKTFRSPTIMTGLFQDYGTNAAPVIGRDTLIGRDLVNLALGAPLGTARSNEVLAIDVDCGVSNAQLVVYDKLANSNIAVIATSDSVEAVSQQDNLANAFANRARFVAHFEIQTLGDEVNGLTGGYLTMAGRIHLDPNTGCPKAILVDKDKADKLFGDRELKKTEDSDEELVRRAGLGHYTGVLKINSNGAATTILIPHGLISIRRQLLP